MENQHRKIKGYRELSAEEIDLMNRIKAAGASLLELQSELAEQLGYDFEFIEDAAIAKPKDEDGNDSEEWLELKRFEAAEPKRWAAIGKTDIQTGIMALVRAVAQPAV